MTDLSPGTRTILTEGVRALAPSQAARDRIRAGVAARIAVLPGSGGAGDSGSSAGAATGGAATGAVGVSGIVKATLFTLIGVIVVGASAVWFTSGDRAPATTAARAPAVAPAAGEPAAARPYGSRAVAPAPALPPRLPADRAPRTARDAADRRRASPPDRSGHDRVASSAADLAREVQLLDRARRAIAASDPDAARAALSRYRREIRAPQMEREALLLQAEAQCAAARTDDGLRTLALVDRRWPGASGVATVRALCTAPR